MKRGAWLVGLALVCTALSMGATLAERIEALLGASPAAKSAFWGVEVVDLSSGQTLYSLNADHFFVPASNTKLFTTSMALVRLGPAYTFETRVVAENAPDGAGKIVGKVTLIGGGDPNLSARVIPYQKGAAAGDPLTAIEDLAAQIAAKGITSIEGDIVGDDSRYPWEPFPPGWSIDDPVYEYGAAVSALTVNDNTITLTVAPGAKAGDPAALTLAPGVEYYRIDNRVRTVAADGERRIHYDRAAGTRDLELWGTIPMGARTEELLLGIEDPAEYAAIALRQALEAHGIAVHGRAVARHLMPNELASLVDGQPAQPAAGTELARRVSAPLLEDLRITDKVSQNLHAEMAQRAVGSARRNIGTREAGLAELKDFLAEVGVADGQYGFNDGSGLSRLNLVTPETVVKLLRYMYQSPAGESWISLLPVGGEDGTLRARFTDPAVSGRVHAKTGSVSHVSALSGYIQKRDGNWVAFSMLVNNFNGPTSEIRAAMDAICALIME